MNRIILIGTLLIFNKMKSQNEINTVISIDDKVAASYNIGNAYLTFSNDTIYMEYESGRFRMEQNDYTKFSGYDEHSDVVLKFDYQQYCPQHKKFTYSISLEAILLKQRYFNISVYNFENYPNLFRNNHDYGFEFTSPVINQVLAKRNRRHIIPRCR